jgi:signal transduction histidine kinase
MNDASALGAELRGTLGRLELALSLVQDSLVWTDEVGRILWCNTAFAELAQAQHIDLIGMPLVDRLPLVRDGRPLAWTHHPVHRVVVAGVDVVDTFELGPRVLEIFGRGRAVPAGRIGVFLVRDITERAHGEAALRELNARLRDTNAELEAFSYSVSHDLRAPLRAMDGFSQMLMEDCAGKLDAEDYDYLRRIRAAAQRMGQLIDDLLTLSRIARGDLHHEVVDVSALARAIADELSARSPDRRVEVVVEDGIRVRGDRRLLLVALENLLDNAWKFTSKVPSARIEIGQTVTDRDFVVYVRDNGAGFDMTFADKLFGAFQRLHTEHEFPGTGIGLATVRRIVHRHGGRVWAESHPPGATFYFALPRQA